MKTLTIVVPKPMQQGQAHYRIPLKAGTGPVPSLQLLIGKKTEVPLADQAHEDLLRADRNLEVLDEDGKHDKSEVDPLEAAFKKLPPELQRAVREGLDDATAELQHELDDLAQSRNKLEAENRDLHSANEQLRSEKAALEDRAKVAAAAIAELEAKLKAAPAPTSPVDEKAAKDAKDPKKGR